jgi:hypothetical protein
LSDDVYYYSRQDRFDEDIIFVVSIIVLNIYTNSFKRPFQFKINKPGHKDRETVFDGGCESPIVTEFRIPFPMPGIAILIRIPQNIIIGGIER